MEEGEKLTDIGKLKGNIISYAKGKRRKKVKGGQN